MHKKTEVGKKIISKHWFISVLNLSVYRIESVFSIVSSPPPLLLFFLSKELDPLLVHVLFR